MLVKSNVIIPSQSIDYILLLILVQLLSVTAGKVSKSYQDYLALKISWVPLEPNSLIFNQKLSYRLIHTTYALSLSHNEHPWFHMVVRSTLCESNDAYFGCMRYILHPKFPNSPTPKNIKQKKIITINQKEKNKERKNEKNHE